MYFERKELEQRITEALDENNIVVVSGSKGVGKTSTVLHYFSSRQLEYVYINMSIIDKLDIRHVDENKRFFVIDEVESSIKEVLDNDLIKQIRYHEENKIIIITRKIQLSKTYPVIAVGPLSNEETNDFLKHYDNIENDDKTLIAAAACGNIALLSVLAELINKEDLKNIRLVQILSDYHCRELLSQFAAKAKSKERTSNESRELLFQIGSFCNVDKQKLIRWNPGKNIEESIKNLSENNYISSTGTFYIPIASKIMSFSDIEKRKYCNRLVKVFDKSIENEEDVLKLISLLREMDERVDFVSDFFEHYYNSMESTEASPPEDFKAIHKMLSDTLKKLDNTYNQVCLNTEVANCISEQISIASKQIDCVSGQVTAVSDQVCNLDMQIRTLSQAINDDIKKIQENSSDDPVILNKLSELEDIIQNPQKSRFQKGLEILNALASIATLIGVNFQILIDNYKALFNFFV